MKVTRKLEFKLYLYFTNTIKLVFNKYNTTDSWCNQSSRKIIKKVFWFARSYRCRILIRRHLLILKPTGDKTCSDVSQQKPWLLLTRMARFFFNSYPGLNEKVLSHKNAKHTTDVELAINSILHWNVGWVPKLFWPGALVAHGRACWAINILFPKGVNKKFEKQSCIIESQCIRHRMIYFFNYLCWNCSENENNNARS